MKKLNKIASLVLALVLALSLAIPVMAADTHTITIGNAVDGEQYTAYKLFDVTYNLTDKAFTYTIVKDSAAWDTLMATAGMDADTLTGYGIKLEESAVSGTYNVVPANAAAGITETDAAALAAGLNAILGGTNFTIPSAGTAEAAKSGETVTAAISVTSDGYYFVDSSLGALCGLNTTTPDVTINEKNTGTDIDKTVKGPDDDAYAKAVDAKIGETVTYQVEVKVPASADKNYIITDTLTAGLTFDAESIECNAVGATINTTPAAGEKWTYQVTFDGADNAGKTVIVTYDAVVNANAVVEGAGNPNDVTLEYGHSMSHDSTAIVYTYEFSLLKYTGSQTAPVELAGAEFALYQGDTQLTFTQTDKGYQYDAKGTVTQIPVGNALIYGLDAGTYTLKEVVVPDGYNAAADVEVVIAATIDSTTGALTAVTVNNGETAVTVTTEATDTAEASSVTYDVGVLNQAGAVMPSTGGIGTTIFYVVGGLLVVCAGVILVSKKRMGA